MAQVVRSTNKWTASVFQVFTSIFLKGDPLRRLPGAAQRSLRGRAGWVHHGPTRGGGRPRLSRAARGHRHHGQPRRAAGQERRTAHRPLPRAPGGGGQSAAGGAGPDDTGMHLHSHLQYI